ncbi:MAG TPA: sugar ABC transporter permease [Spirochaetia bacterium]|nr:sugar ABC transporter permease [Spirochaetia bacterium]
MYIGSKVSDRIKIFYLLFPVIFILLITLVFPSFWAFLLSFFKASLGGKNVFLGLQNYRKVLVETSSFWDSTIVTLLFTLFMVSGEFLLGLSFSLLMARKFPLKRLWISFLIAPLAVSPVVAIIVWKYMLSPGYGMINYLLTLTGVTPPNWFITKPYSFIAICVIDIWLETPFVFAILYPNIISISPTLYEASRIDGATYGQTLRYITLPLIKPAILTTLTFRVIFTLRLFAPVWLFAGGGPAGATRVLSIYLYEQSFVYLHFGLGSAIAWILLVVTMVIATPQIRVMQKTMFGQ